MSEVVKRGWNQHRSAGKSGNQDYEKVCSGERRSFTSFTFEYFEYFESLNNRNDFCHFLENREPQ